MEKMMSKDMPIKAKKDKMHMSKSIKKDDVNKTVNVEEVENGFIIIVNKDWRDKKDGYQYESKKYISTTNPFAEKEVKGSKENSIAQSLENFLYDGNIEIDI